jgi:hypothetical protein
LLKLDPAHSSLAAPGGDANVPRVGKLVARLFVAPKGVPGLLLIEFLKDFRQATPATNQVPSKVFQTGFQVLKRLLKKAGVTRISLFTEDEFVLVNVETKERPLGGCPE